MNEDEIYIAVKAKMAADTLLSELTLVYLDATDTMKLIKPFCRLSQVADSKRGFFGGHKIESATIQFDVWAETQAAANAYGRAIENLFDQQKLELNEQTSIGCVSRMGDRLRGDVRAINPPAYRCIRVIEFKVCS